MERPWDEALLVLDLIRAQHEGEPGLERRRAERLTALFAHARAHSPLYAELYRGLPAPGPDRPVELAALPPVSKPELMARFDDWVTDPAITRADVEAFIADPARIGTLYRGEHFVCTSSGTTGRPGIFIHDADAVAVYRAIILGRIDRSWLSAGDLLGLVRRHVRWAVLVGTGGHFASAGWVELERHRDPFRERAWRVFSVQRPLAELVAELNDFDPGMVAGYPSVLELLADEQAAGRLRIHPVVVETGGESTSDAGRVRMEAAFGCQVRDLYGCSEMDPLGFSCDEGWLHLNSDWAILEPVDEVCRPTPPGEPSHTVLLTNLANRVQPIIRYDLGDSIVTRPDPCPCGLPLPAFRVAGRSNDLLRLTTTDAQIVPIAPLAIVTAFADVPGAARSQIVQTGPSTLRLRIEVPAGVEPENVWAQALARLRAYLDAQGLENVQLLRADELPETSPRSGKLRQVIAAS